MRRPFAGLIAALTLAAVPLHGANGDTAMPQTLTVQVDDIDPSRRGAILVMLFAEDGFPIDHHKAVAQQSRAVEGPSMSFTFQSDLPELAVKVLHDEDETGLVTKNWTGIIPAEGMGFSNGARLSLAGAPKYRDARLSVNDQAAVVPIRMRYPGNW